MIRISISRVKKWRNRGEWRFLPTVTAEGIEIASDDHLMPAICKKLIEAGHEPSEMCEAYRGEMLVFKAQPIGKWAEGRGLVTQEQPERLRRAKQ